MTSPGEGIARRAKRPPATTREARENQLISLAVDLAEKQLIAGTASSQVITHLLKLATTREKIEQEKLNLEKLLLTRKTEQIDAGADIKELYSEALKAMTSYKTEDTPDEYLD